MSDWDDVTVLRKRAPPGGIAKSKSALNSAARSGTLTSVSKGVTNQKDVYDARKMGKLENETEDFHVEKVNTSVSKAIQLGRQQKSMTQKDLAAKIQEKPTVVNDYESGRAANPNQQILAKMERALGIKLRGKGIGEPLAVRGAK